MALRLFIERLDQVWHEKTGCASARATSAAIRIMAFRHLRPRPWRGKLRARV